MTDQIVTLITGGNKGLGYESARRLKMTGHTVYIGARNLERGQTAADELGVGFVPLDVTDDDSVNSAAKLLEGRHGRLDVLINNAAIAGPRKDAWDLTGDDAIEVFDTNLVGVVRVVHAFLPLLNNSDAPVIVNVSSGLGSFGRAQDPNRIESNNRAALYAASKAAVNMLTLRFSQLLPQVRVNAVDPGFTATDLNRRTGTQTVQEGTDAIVELAAIGSDGPDGTFRDRRGTVEW